MGCYLSAPIRSKWVERGGDLYHHASVVSMQGYREHMEDSHILELSLKNHSNISLFGVFDGHNGSRASEYLQNQLPLQLNALNSNDFNNNDKIIQTILNMDQQFCHLTNTQNVSDGTTIVFAIVNTV